MPDPVTIIATAVGTANQLLRFAKIVREVFGEDVTEEQIAALWDRIAADYAEASDAWRAE